MTTSGRDLRSAPQYALTAARAEVRQNGVDQLFVEVDMTEVKVVTCACGMRWEGTLAELIPVVREHGRDVHNMDVTDAQVAAMAVGAGTATA